MVGREDGATWQSPEANRSGFEPGLKQPHTHTCNYPPNPDWAMLYCTLHPECGDLVVFQTISRLLI